MAQLYNCSGTLNDIRELTKPIDINRFSDTQHAYNMYIRKYMYMHHYASNTYIVDNSSIIFVI